MGVVERYETNVRLLDRSRTYMAQRRFLLREYDVRLEFEPEQPADDSPTLLERTLDSLHPKLFNYAIENYAIQAPFGAESLTLSGSTIIATISDDALRSFSYHATCGLLGIVTAGVMLHAETESRGETLNYQQPDIDLALELLAARNFDVNIVPYHLERQKLLDAKFAKRYGDAPASLQQRRIFRESRRVAEQLSQFVPAQAHQIKVALAGYAF